MSRYSHDIQDLALDDMPVTRSQAQNPQCGRGNQGRGRARLDPIARPPTPSRLSATKPSISISSLLREAPTVPSHLDPLTHVQKLEHHTESHGNYYALQFNPASIRLYESRSDDGALSCTCIRNRYTNEPCDHILWLYAGLKNRLHQEPLTPRALDRDTIIQQSRELYSLMNEYRGPLKSDLNELALSNAGPPNTAGLSSPTTMTVEIRKFAVCDMLSTFDVHRLPEDLEQEVHFRQPRAELEDCLHEDRLDRTIFEMAMTDSATFDSLRSTVPEEHRINCYIQKQQDRLEAQFGILDDLIWAKTGEHRDAVVERARALRQIVNRLREYCERLGPQPFPLLAGKRVAEILVADMIEGVLKRDVDLRVQKGGRALARSSNHNLYTNLIGNPSASGGMFVLDTLKALPSEYWKHLIGKLVNLGEQISHKARQSEPGSGAYAARINQLADHLRQ